MGEFKNFAFILFLIGAALAQEKDSSTKLCNNEEGKVFFRKIDACTTLAEQDFFLNFLSNDIYKAACDFLSAKIQCWKSVDASNDCLTDDEMAGIERNIIDKEIEKATNQSDLLGDQYIQSCPIITSVTDDYVNQNFGPNAPCTYGEINEALDARKTCDAALKQKVAFLETFANSVDAWTRIFCLEKTGKLGCFQDVMNCKNSQQREKTERFNQKVFNDEEQAIRGFANGAFEDFSYNDCQRGNRISKRHALMKRSLSSEQVQDLIRDFGERSDLMAGWGKK